MKNKKLYIVCNGGSVFQKLNVIGETEESYLIAEEDYYYKNIPKGMLDKFVSTRMCVYSLDPVKAIKLYLEELDEEYRCIAELLKSIPGIQGNRYEHHLNLLKETDQTRYYLYEEMAHCKGKLKPCSNCGDNIEPGVLIGFTLHGEPKLFCSHNCCEEAMKRRNCNEE